MQEGKIKEFNCFSDFATLEALLHKGPQSVTEIAHRIGLTAGSMTIALDRLPDEA